MGGAMTTTSDMVISEDEMLSEAARAVGIASCSATTSEAFSEEAEPSLTTVTVASAMLLPTSIASSAAVRFRVEARLLALIADTASVELALGSTDLRIVNEAAARLR